LSNLNEKVSSVSLAPERNSPVSLTTLCGSSSLLAQVTVEPALIVSELGANMNSLITIWAESCGAALAGCPAASSHRNGRSATVNKVRYLAEIT
jgi:hypothetical protein